jgi:glycosyltransferase involved in cell wall biosynthesis
MKIALIQDQLLTPAGSERVFYYMTQEFKEADIFTLCYNKNTTIPEFRNIKINTHWINVLIRNHKLFKFFFPLSTYAMEKWNFNSYDLIITSSATTAKYIKKFRGVHVCYCYFPTRAIWNFDNYFKSSSSNNIAVNLFQKLLGYFKQRDIAAARRVTKFIAISDVTKTAISNIYNSDSIVIHSPIDNTQFTPDPVKVDKGYFLVVSRLEKWKTIDYVITAFNGLNLDLRVVGSGPEKDELMLMSNKNITFLGRVGDEELVKLYRQATAVIFPTELEYGLVPLEANACGTPVIALGRGGITETMIPLGNDFCLAPTALYYSNPSASDLTEAIIKFNPNLFSQSALVENANRFSVESFKFKIRSQIKKWNYL